MQRARQRARVRKAEVGGISCVFLDTTSTSTILQPVTVSGHLAAVTVSNVGLQIRDEQVLQAVRALTGRRSGGVREVCWRNIICDPPLLTSRGPAAED